MQLSEVYKIILDLQKKLHSEHATSTNIDEAFTKKLDKTFMEEFQDQQISNKNYYSIIFFLIYYKNTKKFPFVNLNALLLKNVQRNDVDIPSKFEIYDLNEHSLFITLLELVESNALSSIFEDLITFSIIPSLFLTFSEESSFYTYCEFIDNFKKEYEDKKIVKPMHYIFSRSLFLSPMFLKFLRLTLYPIFKPYYEGDFPSNFQDIQNQILQSFEKNVCNIPSHMKIFFNKFQDTSNFLKNCLIEPMIDNPEFFLIFDNLITDNEDLMSHLKSNLKAIFTNNIINDIAKIIDDCSDSEKSLLVMNDTYTYKRIISSLDLDAFTFIIKSLGYSEEEEEEEEKPKKDFFESFDISKYEYKLYSSACDENGLYLYLNMPLVISDTWMHFGKLLKNGLPLPSNYQPPNQRATKDTFTEMIKQLLVDTCDPYTAIDATVTFNEFSSNPNQIETDLKSRKRFLQITRKIMDKNKVKYDYLRELAFLDEKKNNIVELNRELFYIILTEPLIHEKQRNIKADEIISNIQKYNKEFPLYLRELNDKSVQLLGKVDIFDWTGIWFHRFYGSINFSDYCSYRSDLQEFDAMVHEAFPEFIAQNNPTFTQRISVANAMANIDSFEKVFLKLSQAFESNYDPYTKNKEIDKAMKDIMIHLKKYFNAQGSDDFEPFNMFVIAHVNPPHFFTNLIYLLEFLNYESYPSIINIDILRTIIYHYLAICEYLNNTIKLPPKFFYYSRSHRFYLDVFITGNDPDSIIDLFKSFVSLTNNKLPSNEELNRYLENIKGNPKVPVKYTLDFERFSNLLIYIPLNCSVDANIYIGRDIKLISESETSIKLALYAYKKVQGFSFSSVFSKPASEFIKTDAVPNSNKFVVCRPGENADDLNLPNSILSIDSIKVSDVIVKKILRVFYDKYSRL